MNLVKQKQLRTGIILADKIRKKVDILKNNVLVLTKDPDLHKLQTILRTNNGRPIYNASEAALQLIEKNISNLLHALANAKIILTQQANQHE